MSGTLDEMAHGIVTVLSKSPSPEPLRVELKGHSYAEGIYLAQAVADECSASSVPLAIVEIGEPHQFTNCEFADPLAEWGQVQVLTSAALGSAVQFWRWARS